MVVVVGGSAIDIVGKARVLHEGESNPGTVTIRPGGVGRNLACLLRRLGADVGFVTAAGDDPWGEEIMSSLGVLEGNVRVIRKKGLPSPVYIVVVGPKGDTVAGVADMRLNDAVEPGEVIDALRTFSNVEIIAMDANFGEGVLEAVARFAKDKGIPLSVNATSPEKSKKLRKILDEIEVLFANFKEIAALSGINDPTAAAKTVSFAAKHVVVTLGDRGCIVATYGSAKMFPLIEKVKPETDVGIGDAFMAGFLKAFLDGLNIAECVEKGFETALESFGGNGK